MIIALFILLSCILLMLLGVFFGKNLAEKIMSLACVTNYVIVLLCLLSLFKGRDSFVDIAYIYALLGFTANLGILKIYQGRKHD